MGCRSVEPGSFSGKLSAVASNRHHQIDFCIARAQPSKATADRFAVVAAPGNVSGGD